MRSRERALTDLGKQAITDAAQVARNSRRSLERAAPAALAGCGAWSKTSPPSSARPESCGDSNPVSGADLG
jgi:hypothetical protein